MDSMKQIFPFLLQIDCGSNIPVSATDQEAIVKVNSAAVDAVHARKTTIHLIRKTAKVLDRVAKKQKTAAAAGGAVSIIGTLIGMAGGVVTIVTAGAAAVPVAATCLLWTGVGVGLVGGLTKGVGGYLSSSKQDDLIKRLQDAIREDDDAQSRLETCLEELKQEKYEKMKFLLIENILLPGFCGANAYSSIHGGLGLITLISSKIPSLGNHIQSKQIQKLLGSPLVTVLLPLLIKSVGVTAKAGVNITDDIALGAVGGMVEGPTKKIAFVVARNAAAAAMREGGDDAALALAGTASARMKERAAAEAAKKAAKAATKVATKKLLKKATEAAAAEAAKAAAEEAAEKALEGAAKKAAQAGLKAATEAAARKAAEKAAAEGARNVAAEAVKAASKEVSLKVVEAAAAKEAWNAAVKTAAETAAQQATQNVVKTMARVTGGLTIGLGVLFVAWDAYWIYTYWIERTGIPRVENSKFKTIKDYNEHIANQLKNEGIISRFVSVYIPARGDRRTSTFARIGTFKDMAEKILQPDIWPSNVFVREWVY